MAKQLKLKTLLEDIFQEQPNINKYEVVEGVKSFNIVGKQLYNNSNIMEIAKQLSHIAEQAHTHILGEQDDWFDKVSVSKNMQSLKKRVSEFQKTAQESHQLNQRLTGLYEDMGHILNRYYDISEGDELVGEAVGDPDNRDMVDKPNSPAKDGRDNENEGLDYDKGPAKDGNNNPDQYADSDGEEMKESSPGHRTVGQNDPDSGDGGDANGEEIKEVKRLKDVGGVVGIPSLGQIARKFSGK